MAVMTRFWFCVAPYLSFAIGHCALAAGPIDFAHDVLPLIQQHCAECHTNGTYKGGFSMDNRTALLDSETIVPGSSSHSDLVERLTSDDPEIRMPKGGQLKEREIAAFVEWIDQGANWQEGFTFKPTEYKAPLLLRRPEIPPMVAERNHPIDRFVDAHFAKHGIKRPALVPDQVFLRRVSLDIIGDLPNQQELHAFLSSSDPSKRERIIDVLLSDVVGYADHWLTFWNDLLRNDYSGTGYIDGGRKQITEWLYQSLLTNKPYDQFIRELINPNSESEGFIRGIQWRGRVNASQITQLQFAQNVAQVMLGINLKCASCHDSFINDWKLNDAYSMAAIISNEPLSVHRCDVPTGEVAKPGFLFPELGQVDPNANRQQRLAQLSDLMTSPDNGRLARTIVNRIWDRMMGRGIVFPVDIMDNEPWSEDLLDFLSADLVDHGYDLKRTLTLVATSEIYQSTTVPFSDEAAEGEFQFEGPIAKRMTAEQFQDAVWKLTASGPTSSAKGIGFRGHRKVRASLVPSNLLTRSLGRPNREQVVTTRPAQLTTLQALDLTNGEVLAEQLAAAAAKQWMHQKDRTSREIVTSLFGHALSRTPTKSELETSLELLGEPISPDGIADLWWAVMMLPEFQTIR